MNDFLSKGLLEQIFKRAIEEYPKECCGLGAGPRDQNHCTRIYTCRNIQDSLHQEEPEVFSRTSRTAYWMDPVQLLKIHKEIRLQNETLKLIYHSHIDAGAYFSEEDKKMALEGGEPAYADILYLVISVKAGKLEEAVGYRWNPEKKDFLPAGSFSLPRS